VPGGQPRLLAPGPEGWPGAGTRDQVQEDLSLSSHTTRITEMGAGVSTDDKFFAKARASRFRASIPGEKVKPFVSASEYLAFRRREERRRARASRGRHALRAAMDAVLAAIPEREAFPDAESSLDDWRITPPFAPSDAIHAVSHVRPSTVVTQRPSLFFTPPRDGHIPLPPPRRCSSFPDPCEISPPNAGAGTFRSMQVDCSTPQRNQWGQQDGIWDSSLGFRNPMPSFDQAYFRPLVPYKTSPRGSAIPRPPSLPPNRTCVTRPRGVARWKRPSALGPVARARRKRSRYRPLRLPPERFALPPRDRWRGLGARSSQDSISQASVSSDEGGDIVFREG
jgi:hypothetical protein